MDLKSSATLNTATAWTVFEGDKPEPMQVEILGVLKDALGPAHERYYGAGYKSRQHGVEDVRVDMGELRSAGTVRIEPAGSFSDLTAGIEGQYVGT